MTIKVCSGMDKWQNVTYSEYTVNRVHLQNTNEVRKTKDNTEVVLSSILFVDSKTSYPKLDYENLVRTSEANGSQMRCKVYDHAGNEYGDFAVVVCDPVPDVPATRIHHIELSLV